MRLILTYVTIIILFSACETVTTRNSSGNNLTASEERGIEPMLVSSSTPANQSLMALVIGNTEYEFAPLANPINDATDIAKVLRQIGFKVILKTDLDQVAMGDAIRQFTARLSKQSVGLFYFAGHGTQVDGRNYLLPIDNNKIGDKHDLAAYAIDVNRHVLSRMEENNSHLNIVILDACRDNPYRSVSRGADRGLALIQSRLGSIIAFATSPGKTAADVSAGKRNGLYTKYLLKGLKRAHKTHQRIDDMLMQVGNGVTQESRRDQEPWYNASLKAPFCFGGCQLAQVTSPIPTTPKQIPLTSAKPSSATVTSSAQSKAQGWFNKGKALAKLGRYQEAIESFDKALAINPDYHNAWNLRGAVLNNLGRYQEAIENYDKALAIKPDFDWAWNNRGLALDSLGRYQEAIENYNKALAIKPNYYWAWSNRGTALGKLGRYQEAIDSYDKALKLKPNDPDYLNARNWALQQLNNR
jgi:tetratricopeptide (TPR) repeat protein